MVEIPFSPWDIEKAIMRKQNWCTDYVHYQFLKLHFKNLEGCMECVYVCLAIDVAYTNLAF